MPDNNLIIRRAVIDDAPAFARLMSDDRVYPDLLQTPYASLAQWRDRLGNMLAPSSQDLVLVAEQGGEVIGSGSLHAAGMAPRRRHAMILGMSIDGDHQGQGVGHALMKVLTDYADQWANVLRIELQVFADNARAIALYGRHGFEVEGRLRGHALRHGVYVDSLAMARWHPKPARHPVDDDGGAALQGAINPPWPAR